MKNMKADLTPKDKLPKGGLIAFSIRAIETLRLIAVCSTLSHSL
jgi:hypothetical protein